jgi:hypothetical protein
MKTIPATFATARAPKMDEVVCAHNFFQAKVCEADFASDCILLTA